MGGGDVSVWYWSKVKGGRGWCCDSSGDAFRGWGLEAVNWGPMLCSCCVFYSWSPVVTVSISPWVLGLPDLVLSLC